MLADELAGRFTDGPGRYPTLEQLMVLIDRATEQLDTHDETLKALRLREQEWSHLSSAERAQLDRDIAATEASLATWQGDFDIANRLFEELYHDYWWYSANTPLMIPDKQTTRMVPMLPRYAQVYAWRLLWQARRGLPRMVIPKSRQLGMTTMFLGHKYHVGATEDAREMYLVFQDLEPGSKAYQRLTNMQLNQHPDFRPTWGEGGETDRKLVFGETKSVITIESARKKGLARGETLHHFHGSEPAYYDNLEAIKKGVEESVPDVGGGVTSIVWESTCDGVGDPWHEMCQKAERGEGQYDLCFLPWWLEPAYEVQPDPRELRRRPLDAQEEALGKRMIAQAPHFGMRIVPEQVVRKLMWRRRKIETKGWRDFCSEYPATLTEAFTGSGRPVFRTESVMWHRDRTNRAGELEIRDPIARLHINFVGEHVVQEVHKGGRKIKSGRLRKNAIRTQRLYDWSHADDGNLLIWEWPVAGATYIIASDHAHGESEDKTAIQVLKQKPKGGLEQVAVWHGDVGATDSAYLVVFLWKQYGGNRSLMAPERNGPGLTVVDTILNKIRPKGMRLYQYEHVDLATKKREKRYGFNMQEAIRASVIEDLYDGLNNTNLLLHHEKTLNEVQSFHRNKKGKMEAAPGAHDDLLLALMIGWYVRLSHRVGKANVTKRDGAVYDAVGRPPRSTHATVRASGVR